MPIEIDTFQPEKRALGQILSSTSPPIRVPDYQRDFSWKDEQTSDFWSDLITFGGTDPQAKLTGKEYFLGAAVLVNNGTYHLLLASGTIHSFPGPPYGKTRSQDRT